MSNWGDFRIFWRSRSGVHYRNEMPQCWRGGGILTKCSGTGRPEEDFLSGEWSGLIARSEPAQGFFINFHPETRSFGDFHHAVFYPEPCNDIHVVPGRCFA